ncbi:hypothetical protein HPB50_014834 [Hyalomma asiaticum]|uniref:Uncharacterized protein n=1 Tax=Hyalomma asiaticum TaxID=266040 RepID=A0ACB7SYC2_HYAAI|nr:hypothetical protein HPB50_014834 [Hyalomma asiaticum]
MFPCAVSVRKSVAVLVKNPGAVEEAWMPATGAALRATFGDQNLGVPYLYVVSATVDFTVHMNSLFDALNRQTRKEGLKPGCRDFAVLESSSKWLKEWEKMVDGKILNTSFLTQSMAEGFHVTIMSTRTLRSSRRTAQSCTVEPEATATRAFLRCFPGVLRITRTLAAPPFGTVCRRFGARVSRKIKRKKVGRAVAAAIELETRLAAIYEHPGQPERNVKLAGPVEPPLPSCTTSQVNKRRERRGERGRNARNAS